MKGLVVGLACIFAVAGPGLAQTNALAATNAAQGGAGSNSPPGSPAVGRDTAKWTDTIEWAKWAGNVLTTVNLGLVIYLAVQTQRLRQVERKEDLARSVALFWVQDLILKPNLEALHKFFNKYEQEIERLMKGAATGSGKAMQARAAEGIAEFKGEFHDIRRKVLEPLIMISPSFAGLRDIFSSIEDLVCAEYERIPGVARSDGSASNPAEGFRGHRARFFSDLHRSQVELVAPPVANKA